MMRSKACVLIISLIVMLTVTSPSHAATTTFVQTFPDLVQAPGDADFGLRDVIIRPFNPTLGTLLQVTVELIGIYQPGLERDSGPYPPTTDLVTDVYVVAGRPPHPGPWFQLTQFDVPIIAPDQFSIGVAIGVPEAVDLTIDYTRIADWESLQPVYGFGYGFLLAKPFPFGHGDADDLTTFTGSAVLTYTYDATGPATVLLLAIGLLGIAWSRRRIGLRQT